MKENKIEGRDIPKKRGKKIPIQRDWGQKEATKQAK
jgi:hypothetical protein